MESALIYDAVQLFTATISNLSKEIEIIQTPTPCNSSESWKHGFTLINHMKMAVSYLINILNINTDANIDK